MDAKVQDVVGAAELAMFARAPIVIQAAPSTDSRLFFDALKAMDTSMALRVATTGADWKEPGRWPVVSYGKKVALAGETIPEDEHSAIIREIGDRVRAEAPGLAAIGIRVLDRKGVDPARNALDALGRNDPVARAFANTPGVKSMRNRLPFVLFVKPEGGSLNCVVTGSPTSMTMRDLTAYYFRGKPNYGAATARDFHLWTNWHEVGHCLLGASEAEAEAFGLLMLVKSGGSRDMVDAVHVLREGMETFSPILSDDNHVSGMAGWVSRMYDRLRADTAFMSMDLGGVAVMAKEISERHSPTAEARADGMAVRRSIYAGATSEDFAVDTGARGNRRTFKDWMTRCSETSPVLARALDIMDRTRKGPRRAARYVVDRQGFDAFLEERGASGDATAARMLAALRETHGVAPLAAWKGLFVAEDDGVARGKAIAVEASEDQAGMSPSPPM
jgi:hypothetical protein